LYDTTLGDDVSSAFPDDELRQLLEQLVRMGNLLEPGATARHDHAGIQVSTSEVFALGRLAEAGAQSQQELGAHLGLEKSTVSRLVAGMAERGWLSRERQPDNRRLYRVALTDLGRDVARRVGADLREHHARLLGGLTAAEREGLAVGLSGLVRVLRDHHARRHPAR
jgi:DNA-binding MarR family transcriptional regulator